MFRKLLVIGILSLAIVLAACGSAGTAAPVAGIQTDADASNLPDEISVHTAAALRDSDEVLLIDVREPWEYDEVHIPGITLIPMNQIPDRLDEIPRDREVIVTCRTGNRSGQVTDYLRQAGFDNVHNMAGGIVAWEEAGYPVQR